MSTLLQLNLYAIKLGEYVKNNNLSISPQDDPYWVTLTPCNVDLHAEEVIGLMIRFINEQIRMVYLAMLCTKIPTRFIMVHMVVILINSISHQDGIQKKSYNQEK